MYSISIEKFSGPLDLLLHLIEKAELDIKDIFVSEITAQYIEYLGAVENLDMETASEFITMAARLVYIKSRSLLPKPPREDLDYEEVDPEELLIRQLREYKAFKEATELLSEVSKSEEGTFSKLPEELILPNQETIFIGGTAGDLYSAFLDVIMSIDERGEVMPKNIPLTHEVTADEYTIRSCTSEIRHILKEQAKVEFAQLFPIRPTRLHVIVVFMALLEMLMRSEVFLSQDNAYNLLYIEKNELKEDDDTMYMDEYTENLYGNE